MKKTAKRLLSMALVLVMVLSLLPAVTLPAQAADGDTTDAFGITMTEWTDTEKAAAEPSESSAEEPDGGNRRQRLIRTGCPRRPPWRHRRA